MTKTLLKRFCPLFPQDTSVCTNASTYPKKTLKRLKMPATSVNAGIGRSNVLMSPKKLAPKPKPPPATVTSGRSVLKQKLPKKPDNSVLASDVAFLGAPSNGARQSAPTTVTDNFEALWSNLDEVQPSHCKYENDHTSPLLKEEDPFLPRHKSPAQQGSVEDLWSIEGVTNSTQVEWDPNDPFIHCVNPYVAEGRLPVKSQQPSGCTDDKPKQVQVKEGKVEKSIDVVEIKEEEVDQQQEAATEFLAEIKSEPEQNIQCPQVPIMNNPQELQVLKAEFVYISQQTPDNMELNILDDVCDDQVSVQTFQALLDGAEEPDPEFIAQAERDLQAVTAERQKQQQQQTPVFDTINLHDINDMVDPAILPFLEDQPPFAPYQILSNPNNAPCATASEGHQASPRVITDQVPDLLEDLVENIILSEDVPMEQDDVPSPEPVVVDEEPRRRQGRPQVARRVGSESHKRAPRVSLRDPTARYERMRALNNDASARCRQKRKMKFQELVEELKVQETRNEDLKMKYNLLVEAKDQAKKMFLEMIANGARPRV